MVSHPGGPLGPTPPLYVPPPPKKERSEKTKMLCEEPFHPYDRELVAERERCERAVYAFNNTSNNNQKISEGEVRRIFRLILSSHWNQTISDGGPSGHLGTNVVVSRPFMCEYGYNIHIGSNVEIGKDCTFLDAGDITIGDNTSIGASVTINTVRTPTDPRSPKGTGPLRTSVAGKVHIGKNVSIGTKCIIKAGVSIGENAIIDDGTVVSRVRIQETALPNRS